MGDHCGLPLHRAVQGGFLVHVRLLAGADDLGIGGDKGAGNRRLPAAVLQLVGPGREVQVVAPRVLS